MKKILLCLVIAVALSNCEFSVQKSNAQYSLSNISCGRYYCVEYEKVTIDSIEFGVFQHSNSYGGIYIVNFTKEKLEIELLKKQLSNK